MRNNRKIILKLVYIAMFAALCFVGTMISFPVGPSKVHFGNFFCILCGLLCGGLVGGLAGSIGMGLNDIVFGYTPDVYIRTIILKFLMGFVVGTLFRFLLKKKADGKILNCIGTAFMAIILIVSTVCFILKIGKASLWIMILSALLFLVFLVITVLTGKLGRETNCLSFSLLVSISVNVLGEFITRIIFKMILGVDFQSALSLSIASLPGGLLTSLVTICIIIPTFIPLYKASYRLNRLNDLEPLVTLEETKKGEEKHEAK